MTDKAWRVRDGIAGGVVVVTAILGGTVNPAWLWITGLAGVLLILSGCFGVCFLHSFLGKCGLKNK